MNSFFRRAFGISKALNPRFFSPHYSHLHHAELLFTTGTVGDPSSSSASKITYLITKCGLSVPAAESALPKLKLNTTDRADAVLSVLRSHGVSDTYITKLVGRHPLILTSCVEILRAKIKFLASKGFSGEDIGRLFHAEGQFLATNLENRIAPNYDLLVDFLGAKDKAFMAILKVPRLLLNNLHTTLLPNVETLRKHGVKGSNFDIFSSLKSSRAMFRTKERFEECIKQLVEMGYDISTRKNRLALFVIASNSSAMWDRKVEMLRSIGWTKEDILIAFETNPNFIEVAAEKIRQKILFLMDKFNHSKEAIVRHPVLLMLSLERRIIPRSSVYNILVTNGIVKTKMCEINMFIMSEKNFLKKYVDKYRDKIPQVVDAHEGRLDFAGMELECYRLPNIEILKTHNVPESSIEKLIRKRPRVLSVNCAHFETVIRGLEQMGFSFKSEKFIDALSALVVMSDLTSKSKFGLYRSLGWSHEDIVKAIKKQPNFVSLSFEQIKKIVHACVNNLGWRPTDIAACPSILLCDLEKCILPRCLVFKMLVSKGVLQKTRPGDGFFRLSDNRFFKKYVQNYQDKIPELLEVYEGHTTFDS